MVSIREALVAHIGRLEASNKRMRACLNALAADRAGTGTHRTMIDVCRRVTAADLAGEPDA